MSGTYRVISGQPTRDEAEALVAAIKGDGGTVDREEPGRDSEEGDE